MNREEAKEIFDSTVKPYKDNLELARVERAELKGQYDEACKQCKKAYQEYKQAALEAREIYNQNIGEV